MPLTIIIDLDPNIVRLGPLLITWHGVFSVLGIIAAARLGFWLLEKDGRSEEHTSELQSQSNLVCRLLLEKKKNSRTQTSRWVSMGQWAVASSCTSYRSRAPAL